MIEQVLADFSEEVAVLKRAGHPIIADNIGRVLSAVAEALPEYLTWYTEGEAMLRSGRGVDYFRSRFDEWQTRGLAERRGRHRRYRGVVVQQRILPSLHRAAAERSA